MSIGNVVAVASLFATYANSDGTSVYPSCSTVATAMQVNPSTVKRAVKVLRETGLLQQTREATAQRPAHYRLTLPVGVSVPATQPEPDELEDVPSFDQDDDDQAQRVEPEQQAAGVSDPWAFAARDDLHGRSGTEPLDLEDVPSFDQDDDEPHPEPARLGRFGAREAARRERDAARAAREPDEYRPRYGG